MPWRRGTRLAAELDRRLAGDESLDNVVDWWTAEWCNRARLRVEFPDGGGDGDVQPVNFSANEHTVFMISTLNGRYGADDKTVVIHSLWPMAEVDGARIMTDAAYARQVMKKYIERLVAARAELRRSRN